MSPLRRPRLSLGLVAFLAASTTAIAPALAVLPPLIPRAILFGNPERVSPQLSPDGKRLAWVAPDSRNVLQVWVETVGKKDARPVTKDQKRGIRRYFWAENNRTLLYMQDRDGDENWHVFGVDVTTGVSRDYTPFKDVMAYVMGTEPAFPETVLVASNHRTPELHDIYRLDLKTGKLTLDTRNPGDVQSFMADSKLRVRMAERTTPDGGTELRVRAHEKAPWKSWLKAGPEEVVAFEGFTAGDKAVVLSSSLGSDTSRVVERRLDTGKQRQLAWSPEVDAGAVLMNPASHKVEAVAFAPGRTTWTVVDPAVRGDFAGIRKLNDGDFSIASRTRNDRKWLVAFNSDRGPVRYYMWDRDTQRGTFMFSHQPKLEGLSLAPMKPVTITSRDGLKLHSYLTVPVGVEARKLPMVLLVHGGPWGRDHWGYDAEAQWHANRGYAVLQMNFRGSTGYGKKFLNAGNRQWGLKMHDDLIDGVEWAVKQGVADPDKVGIVGGSYGGYAALAGLAFTPETFACGVDIVGPVNLFTLIRTIPPYWKPMRAMFDLRVGNIDDPKDEIMLKRASPLYSADQIRRPLLIGQGANDPRVKQAESEQIVEAIEKSGGQATYVVYPDEGHGFARPENRIDFNARVEAFLAEHLGGRFEPMAGDRIPGSTAIVKEIGPR